jgi:SMC interacting uncharacterized protein involved in chromosome segregation
MEQWNGGNVLWDGRSGSLHRFRTKKKRLDGVLQQDLARYDSAFVENIRAVDRRIATLVEQRRFLEKHREMPRAINGLEEEDGALQGIIDRLQSEIAEEKSRLRSADENIAFLAKNLSRSCSPSGSLASQKMTK